jgi:hypothetical protein
MTICVFVQLAIEIQGSSAWSSVKVRQMVARLFRAVAAMDVKVTDNNNAVNSKIAALKAKVHGTRAVNTHQSRLVHTPDSAKIQSELKSLRKQVVTEASELEVMNKTTRAEQMNMHGGLASLRNRIKTDYAALRDDISLAQKRLALHVKSNLSRVIEKIRHEKDSEIDGERIEERHALQIKKVLANLQVLAASMHSQVTAVDNDMMSRDFDYRRKFRSLQHKVKIDSGLIRSMREKEENFKSDADDLSRIRIGNVHKLSRELAKVRLMEKAEAARAAGLKKGLLAVEEDVTLLRNEEKGLRSRETSEQQKERDASQKLSSVNRHVEHLDEVGRADLAMLLIHEGISTNQCAFRSGWALSKRGPETSLASTRAWTAWCPRCHSASKPWIGTCGCRSRRPSVTRYSCRESRAGHQWVYESRVSMGVQEPGISGCVRAGYHWVYKSRASVGL